MKEVSTVIGERDRIFAETSLDAKALRSQLAEAKEQAATTDKLHIQGV